MEETCTTKAKGKGVGVCTEPTLYVSTHISYVHVYVCVLCVRYICNVQRRKVRKRGRERETEKERDDISVKASAKGWLHIISRLLFSLSFYIFFFFSILIDMQRGHQRVSIIDILACG